MRTNTTHMRRFRLPYLVLCCVLITGLLFRLSYDYFVAEEMARAEGRLSLYQSTVDAELERFSHLTHVLARDSYVRAALDQSATVTLNFRLAEFAQRAGLEAIYLMDTGGRTISASNFRTPLSFVGKNYGFRPYFKSALEGRQGRFYAIGSTTGTPGYFIADPVRRDDGTVIGVVAIKVGLKALAESWRSSGEKVLLADDRGVVILSSMPDWQYKLLRPLAPEAAEYIKTTRQFGSYRLTPLDWHSEPEQRARIEDDTHLHVHAPSGIHGWEVHYFASDDRAVARSGLITAVAAVAAGLALGALQLYRTRRIREALRRSEREESSLRATNARLAHEISERRLTEQRLERTQEELNRAGRLAALGQISASVTHELGQPIAAMRNHLVAAQISGAQNPGAMLNNLTSLVDRMDGITRQLKFFARSGKKTFDKVEMEGALRAALELMAPTFEQQKIVVETNIATGLPSLRGNRLRLEQVVVNLLRNAADAIEGVDTPRIHLDARHQDGSIVVEVRDNGHGLGANTLSDLQEPFVTTRESGRGMGLGLAISAQIVKEHGGEMSAANRKTGGACFCVRLPVVESPNTQETT
ncbi:sensor histidine kinase [Tritonibacter aquimaris]|nr:ATP-binding protein [Tritonibacter aquimaris]